MQPDAKECALILAVMLNRSGLSRCRISRTTIRMIGRRNNLRSAHVVSLTAALVDRSWILCELDSGGFGAIKTKSLEAAKPVTGKKYLTAEERAAIKRGNIDFDALEEELLIEEGLMMEEEEN